jgi:hypothetical protein
MDADDAVAAHFKKRVDRSLSMTGFVTGNCAGIVHWELAARCRTKLASLRRLVPARRPQIHAVVLQQEIEDRRQVLPSTPNRNRAEMSFRQTSEYFSARALGCVSAASGAFDGALARTADRASARLARRPFNDRA